MRRRTPQLVVLLLLSFFTGLGFFSCSAGSDAHKKARSAAQQGEWDVAVVHYTRAVNEDPGNIEYRLGLERALIEAGAYHVQQGQKRLAAEDLEEAVAELELSINLDPTNRYAQSILEETKARLKEREALQDEAESFETRRRRARELFGQRPILEPSSAAPIQLRFAEDTSLQKIFEVLSKLSGINVLFDESFRDKRVTIDLVDVSFVEALDKLVLINRLFYKVVDSSTIIISRPAESWPPWVLSGSSPSSAMRRPPSMKAPPSPLPQKPNASSPALRVEDLLPADRDSPFGVPGPSSGATGD